MTRLRYSAKLRAMKILFVSLLVLPLSACNGGLWNNPYPAADECKPILYTAFTERPKHLDPAQAYSENEYEFLAQIYAPPLQYHYLKRPYELVPLAASGMPSVRYLDRKRRPLPATASAEKIAFSVYEIRIKSDMRYQPHPAFVPENLHLASDALRGIHAPGDFPRRDTRTVNAAD